MHIPLRAPLVRFFLPHLFLWCRHTIEPGRWTLPLASGVSVKEAIHQWYIQLNNQTIQKEFRDSCNQPYCNDQCPERFTLGELTANNWPLVVKIVIAAVVAAIGLICVFCKFCFKLWLLWLEKKQDNYLEGLDIDLEAGVSRLEVSWNVKIVDSLVEV